MNRVETLASFFGDREPAPEPAISTTPSLTAEQHALVAEACGKAGVVWLCPLTQARPRPAWFAWHEDAVHVVSGVGEQLLPPLDGLVSIVVPSKDTRARLLTLIAMGTALSPGTPAWDAAVFVLSAIRLNATDPAGQAERWRTGCAVVRLDPLHLVHAGAGPDDSPAMATPVPPNPATTTGWRPWHLGGRPARRGGRR